jgi:hypothetical protein
MGGMERIGAEAGNLPVRGRSATSILGGRRLSAAAHPSPVPRGP